MKKLFRKLFSRETPGEPIGPPRMRTVNFANGQLYEVRQYVSPTEQEK